MKNKELLVFKFQKQDRQTIDFSVNTRKVSQKENKNISRDFRLKPCALKLKCGYKVMLL